MSITTSSEWKSLIMRAGSKVAAVIRLCYGDQSGTNYLSLTDATKTIKIGTEKFAPFLNRVPAVDAMFNVVTHEHSVSNLTIEIDNLNMDPNTRFSDLISSANFQSSAANQGFYNRRIDIALYIEGITSFANCFHIMSNGVIRDIRHTREVTQIDVEDGSILTDLVIGDLVGDSDAADGEGGILPTESKGKTKPIIWGDRTFNFGSSVPANYTTNRVDAMTKCVYLGWNATTSLHHYLVAGHELNSLPATGAIWGYDQANNRMVSTNYTVVQNTSAGAIIGLADGEDFVDYIFPDTTLSNKVEDSGGGSAASVADESNMADHDVSTFGRLSCDNAIGGAEPTASIDIDFPSYTLNGTISSVTVWGLANYTGNGVNYIGTINGDDAESDDGTAFLQHATQAASEAGAAASVTVSLIGTELSADAAQTLDIYEVFKKIVFTPTSRFDIYAAVKGREYGTWINDRSTVEGFTETHEDDDSAGSLIQNYAGIVEDVLRSYMALGNTQIDRGALNIASNDLPVASYMGAPAIINRVSARDFLFELMRDCRSYLWRQPDGTIKMQVLEDIYSSSTRTIDTRDIRQLVFDRTKMADLKTAVDINYGWNERESRYLLNTGISEDTDLQTRYNVTQTQSLLGEPLTSKKSVLGSTTAGNMQLFERNFWMQPHNRARGILTRNHLDLDLGDRLDFSNLVYKPFGEDITAAFDRNEDDPNSQTIYPYFYIYRIKRGRSLYYEAIQLHRLDLPA